jgi:hypothetical protein
VGRCSIRLGTGPKGTGGPAHGILSRPGSCGQLQGAVKHRSARSKTAKDQRPKTQDPRPKTKNQTPKAYVRGVKGIAAPTHLPSWRNSWYAGSPLGPGAASRTRAVNVAETRQHLRAGAEEGNGAPGDPARIHARARDRPGSQPLQQAWSNACWSGQQGARSNTCRSNTRRPGQTCPEGRGCGCPPRWRGRAQSPPPPTPPQRRRGWMRSPQASPGGVAGDRAARVTGRALIREPGFGDVAIGADL